MKPVRIVVILVYWAIFSLPLSFVVKADDLPNPEWELKSIAQVENNPLLTHFTYEVSRPPYCAWDRIRLHRGVLDDQAANPEDEPPPARDNRKVILMIPGTWNAGGWSKITDPTLNPMLHLANNGYDVFTMDYRTVNIPDLAYEQYSTQGIDLSPTTDWTYAVFREDIKACVEKIKELTGARKIFLSGFSRGGVLMYIYASKYQSDLKGLISLDGGIKDSIPYGVRLDESTYNQIVALFKEGVFIDPNTHSVFPWLAGITNLDERAYNSMRLAGVLPYARILAGAPLPEEFDNVSDWVADKIHYMLGEGLFTNYHGGYIRRDILVTVMNEFTRYTPNIQTLEDSQLMAHGDVPYFDYDDNDIFLPTIAFLTEIMCPQKSCQLDILPNMTKSKDITIIFLEEYGHMDVLFGTYSLADVKNPLLEWLNNHL